MTDIKKEHEEFLKGSELFQASEGKDSIYNFNRNCENRLDVLKECERMWLQFKPINGDKHFIREFRDKFRQKWWELFLADRLINEGKGLNKSPAYGPDINFGQTPKCWVEAISMTDGTGGNAVPGIVYGEVQHVPGDAILSRVTAGFKEKTDKFKKYIEDGVVSPGDQLIIAIDMSGVSHADIDDHGEMPLACKALLGIVELTMSIPVAPKSNADQTTVFYPHRPHISKPTGTKIPATGLLSKDFEFISGVITNVRRFTETVENPNCLRLVMNPLALNPLNINDWKFVRDIFYGEDGSLKKWDSKSLNQID